jgi:hypothetical protein
VAAVYPTPRNFGFSPQISERRSIEPTRLHHPTMAKSKSKVVAKTEQSSTPAKSESKSDGPLTTKVANGTPYQLDPAQVERAATALVKHMKQHAEEKEEGAGKKNLAADEDEPEENDLPIFLTLATKQHVKDSNKLKPNKMLVLPFASSVEKLIEMAARSLTQYKARKYEYVSSRPILSASLRTLSRRRPSRNPHASRSTA